MNQGDALVDVSVKGTDGDEPGPEEGALDLKVGQVELGCARRPDPLCGPALQAQAEASASDFPSQKQDDGQPQV